MVTASTLDERQGANEEQPKAYFWVRWRDATRKATKPTTVWYRRGASSDVTSYLAASWAMSESISKSVSTAAKAVMSELSYGGETSTISAATR